MSDEVTAGARVAVEVVVKPAPAPVEEAAVSSTKQDATPRRYQEIRTKRHDYANFK